MEQTETALRRTQFTFYESFYTALRHIKQKSVRCDVLDALCVYALYGQPPPEGSLTGAAAMAFDLIRPNLDASRRKALSGSLGGSAPKAKGKQAPSEGEDEGEGETEKETETESKSKPERKVEDKPKGEGAPPPAGGGSAPSPGSSGCPGSPCCAEVWEDDCAVTYLKRLDPTGKVSPSCFDKLRGYERDLGTTVCVMAIEEMVFEQKMSWGYLRAILEDKRQRGIRSGEDYERYKEERQKRYGG